MNLSIKHVGRAAMMTAIAIAAMFGPGSGSKLATAASEAGEAERVVIAGGDLTEIAYLLDAESALIGVDTTSTWPPPATELPQIGYVRQLSAEGVLSLAPDLFLGASDAGPAIVLNQLRDAGVEVAIAPAADGVEDIPEKIAFVGAALGVPARAEALVSKFEDELSAAEAKVAQLETKPRVLFILSMQNGAPLVAGDGTSAARMIELAAGENAVSGFQGYKPMSAEAIIEAAPDIVLMMRQHAEQIGGSKEVLARPEIAMTPAGQKGRVVTMDGMKLLGFGPRTPEAVIELARLLHPDGAREAGL